MTLKTPINPVICNITSHEDDGKSAELIDGDQPFEIGCS